MTWTTSPPVGCLLATDTDGIDPPCPNRPDETDEQV